MNTVDKSEMLLPAQSNCEIKIELDFKMDSILENNPFNSFSAIILFDFKGLR
jgi:hypothetical protein